MKSSFLSRPLSPRLVTALSLVGGMVLVGCTVGPNYQRPDLTGTLPAHFQQLQPPNLTSSATSQNDPLWWKAFHDEAINQLVASALARNLDLTSADANIHQARAQLGMIESASQPKLNADGRLDRDQFSLNSENFANIPFANPKNSFTDYRAGFDASWEIDLFGHTARSVEAAEARLDGLSHQRENAALRITAEVVRNVIDYRSWLKRSQNADAIRNDYQQLASLTEVQKKAGLVSDSDVTETQTGLHNSKSQLPPLKAASTASLMALTVLVNQPQEQILALLNANPEAPLTSELLSPGELGVVDLPSDLLQRRPDLQLAESELAAATADIGVAIAEQYPQISLVGDLGLDSITPGKFATLASRYWNVGPQVSIPLLNGGRLTAQVNAREAARDAAIATYRQAVLSAFADVETALIRYQHEQQRLTQINQALESQQRQLTYAQKRYQFGETNQISVLQTHLQLAQIMDAQIASEQACQVDLTGVFKALGGGIRGSIISSKKSNAETPTH